MSDHADLEPNDSQYRVKSPAARAHTAIDAIWARIADRYASVGMINAIEPLVKEAHAALDEAIREERKNAADWGIREGLRAIEEYIQLHRRALVKEEDANQG